MLVRAESRNRCGTLAALVMACGVASVRADIITDAGFFTGIPGSYIDFETDGSGTPIVLGEGFSQAMPQNAYSSLGLTVSSGMSWVNDAGPLFDAAQLIGGSPNNAIPGGAGLFTLNFSSPVQAFGMWVMNNRTRDAAGPQMRIFGVDDTLIATIQFDDGGVFVDGLLSNGITEVDYGFMGFAGDVGISRVEVTKIAASFDDLYFSIIPSPGGAAVLALAAGLCTRRRRA